VCCSRHLQSEEDTLLHPTKLTLVADLPTVVPLCYVSLAERPGSYTFFVFCDVCMLGERDALLRGYGLALWRRVIEDGCRFTVIGVHDVVTMMMACGIEHGESLESEDGH
jgi:hypothetical protein